MIFLSLSELSRRAHPKSDLSLEASANSCSSPAFRRKGLCFISTEQWACWPCLNRDLNPLSARLPPTPPFPGDRENELMLCLLLQLFPLLYQQVFIALEEEAVVWDENPEALHTHQQQVIVRMLLLRELQDILRHRGEQAVWRLSWPVLGRRHYWKHGLGRWSAHGTALGELY